MIRLILILVILLVVMGLAGFSVKDAFQNPQVKSNIEFVTKPIVEGFNNYIKPSLLYFWNNIFIKLLWSSFISNMERIKNGEPDDFQMNAPYVMPNNQ